MFGVKNNTLRLIRIQLLDVTGLNQTRYNRGKKSKGTVSAVMILFMGAIFAIYSAMLAQAYMSAGMGSIVMPMMFMAASIAVLFTSIMKTSGLIFAARDFDMLQALPIRPSDIITSRFITLYLLDVGFCLCIMVPAGIIYGVHQSMGLLFYIGLIIETLFTPVIPLIIATIIGTLLLAISARFRHKNLIMIVLSVVALCAFMLLTMNMSSMDTEEFASLNDALLGLIYKTMPTARLFYDSLCEGRLLSFAIFILINAVIYAVFMAVISHFYKKINTAVTTHRTRSDYKLTAQKSSSAFFALYKKELRRYFSSPIYVLNTILGPVFMVAIGVVVLLGYGDSIINLPGISAYMPAILPLILGFCAVMNATTASSISLEGQGFWQLLVLPVSTRDILNSKRMLNFTFALPASVIAGILIEIKLRLPLWPAIAVFLVPLAYTWLTAEAGLFFNLKYPNFQWKTETAVVKQSAPTMITVMGGMLLTFAPIFLVTQLPLEMIDIVPAISILLPARLAIICRGLGRRIPLNQLDG